MYAEKNKKRMQLSVGGMMCVDCFVSAHELWEAGTSIWWYVCWGKIYKYIQEELDGCMQKRVKKDVDSFVRMSFSSFKIESLPPLNIFINTSLDRLKGGKAGKKEE